MMDQGDNDLVLLLAGSAGCSLDSSSGSNWVEKSGGLPGYICQIAKAVIKSGKPKGQAIAIAVSRVKKWATGGDNVDADTRAKAAKAVAAWEALKTRNKARKVHLSHRPEDGASYLMLSNVSVFNTEIVRRAFDAEQRRLHEADVGEAPLASTAPTAPWLWIKELWTDHIIVSDENTMTYQRISYSVDDQDQVSFGKPVDIKQVWIEDDPLSAYELALLSNVIDPTGPDKTNWTPAQRIMELSRKLGA